MVSVTENACLTVTLRKLKAMDSVSGQILFEELNQCNVIFHSLAWDPTSQDVACLWPMTGQSMVSVYAFRQVVESFQVIVCDSKGNLGFYNLIQEIGESRARFLKLPGGVSERTDLPPHLASLFSTRSAQSRTQGMQERSPVQASYGL